jgi:type II secretory pathway predicted ATPase ExeA
MPGIPPPGQRAFSETADPTAYVPRAETERVLSSLQDWSRDDTETSATLAALIAPPGFGKTFLLRLLESRAELRSATDGSERRALYLPYAGLLPQDLAEWVHGLLGRPMPPLDSEDPAKAALGALVSGVGQADRPFFLLLDDADSMPEETIRALLGTLPRARSPLRILMALNEDARSSRQLAAFDAFGTIEVRLDEPMSEEETAAYVRARLSWAGLEAEMSDALDTPTLRRIHALSGGVPRQVHRVAESIFDPASTGRPSDLEAKLRREDWMGRPIEDDL